VPRSSDMPSACAAALAVESAAYPYPWTEGIFRDCLRVGYHCLDAEPAPGTVPGLARAAPLPLVGRDAGAGSLESVPGIPRVESAEVMPTVKSALHTSIICKQLFFRQIAEAVRP
jgi:hypothetical protein